MYIEDFSDNCYLQVLLVVNKVKSCVDAEHAVSATEKQQTLKGLSPIKLTLSSTNVVLIYKPGPYLSPRNVHERGPSRRARSDQARKCMY